MTEEQFMLKQALNVLMTIGETNKGSVTADVINAKTMIKNIAKKLGIEIKYQPIRMDNDEVIYFFRTEEVLPGATTIFKE